VVNPSQIRRVIEAMKQAVETQIFPARQETPKTLIFAKTDSHADDIIQIVREVYGQGNAFCKKVTYRTDEDPDSVLASFRNDYHPRIAVTVDMIATGTDVKPLEVLLFMRDVRSRGYYEQMKGRGVRSLDADDLRAREQQRRQRQDPLCADRRRGRGEVLKTESRPLEKKPGVALKDLLQGVAIGQPRRRHRAVAGQPPGAPRQTARRQGAGAHRESINGGVPVGALGRA
jgi:type I restriction enzyme R subunit